MDNLAEDYAAMKGWCNFSAPAAQIRPLTKVDEFAYSAFQQPPLVKQSEPVEMYHVNGYSF